MINKSNIKIHSSHYLIALFTRKRLLREYGYFLKFKYCKVSSCIHRDQYIKTLSEETKVSRSTVQNQIRKMRKLGWIKENDRGDLIFISHKDLYEKHRTYYSKYRCIIELKSVSEPISRVLARISHTIVDLILIRQSNKIFYKRDQDYRDKWREIEPKRLYHGKRGTPTYDQLFTCISSKKFGFYIGKGKSSGNRMKLLMKRMRLIQVRPLVYKVGVGQQPKTMDNRRAQLTAGEICGLSGSIPGTFFLGGYLVKRGADIITSGDLGVTRPENLYRGIPKIQKLILDNVFHYYPRGVKKHTQKYGDKIGKSYRYRVPEKNACIEYCLSNERLVQQDRRYSFLESTKHLIKYSNTID